uniref:AIP3 domain-containing protein n=1 Tax=Angiostrongylus cantonensis TaxID=6313 RepID=A0A0K0CUM9_ANGCA
MPGIFSWKNRILGRKTPEPERAKHVTVVSEPLDIDLHNQAPRRSVRFNDTRNKFSQYNVSEWQNEYGEVRLIGSVAHNNVNGVEKCEQPSSNWRYAESSAFRMAMVPLAISEVTDDEPPREQHYSTQVPSKAGHALQLLRERSDHGSSHEARRSTTLPPVAARPVTPVMSLPSEYGVNSSNRWEVVRKEQSNGDFGSMGRQLEQMNVVFLQANDEVKRTILPPEVHSIGQVKMAFVRAFPNIPRHYIEHPSVKVYIQEPSKGQLFYELDDPSDIRNKSVLKLRDHTNTGMQSPVRFLDQRDFLADFESDISRQRFVFNLKVLGSL